MLNGSKAELLFCVNGLLAVLFRARGENAGAPLLPAVCLLLEIVLPGEA